MLRSPDTLPQLAFGFITACCLVIAGLIALETLSGIDAAALRAFTVLALLLICFAAWTFTRQINSSWHRRQSIREEQAAAVADQVRSRYLAHMSHEFRSPLNAIYGYAQLVERGEGVNPQEAAKVIRRCAEHMTSLVEGLLDIWQVQNGVMRIKTDVIQPAYFLDQIVAMMRPAATAKGLAFHYEPSARLPAYVRIDQSRFRQVLINLLTNAIKYTDRGSVTLRVHYSGQTARFEIIDTGPGILQHDRERIFDLYDRGGDDTALTRPGLGLGLSISRSIIHILGGALELDSTPGEGSCFRVIMMLGEVPGHAVPAQLSRRASGYLGSERVVLVVDDDPAQRQFIATLLNALGFAVFTAASGEEGLEQCRQRRFDLAILDISLPGISGWETALQLRGVCHEDLRILMLSANAQEFHRPEHETPVHDFFLVKPVEFGLLVETIGGLLNLSWLFDAEVGDAAAMDPAALLGDAARPHVNRLRELVRIGHVRGIETEIKLLAAQGGRAERLASELFKHLDRFDLASIGRVLEGV